MPLRICFATAEMAPFAKVGGLGDVSGALAKYLHAAGHDIRLFLPAYASIPRAGLEAWPVDFLQDVPVRIGTHDYRFSIETARLPGSRAFVYLVHCAELFERATIYSSAADEHRRFLLLTHAMFLACQRMAFAPQILHLNDWHTAIGALWLRSVYAWDALFRQTRSVLTMPSHALMLSVSGKTPHESTALPSVLSGLSTGFASSAASPKGAKGKNPSGLLPNGSDTQTGARERTASAKMLWARLGGK